MGTLSERSRVELQASGFVSVQADCTLEEAFVLMENRAVETGQTVVEIAKAVVARMMRFD